VSVHNGGGAIDFMVAADTERFGERELSLPADLSRLLDARRFAEEAAADFGFDDAARQQIKLAANEAVANAMEHGSRTPEDEVALRAAEEDGALAIYVRDAGNFVPRVMHRGAMPERGRGLAFMDLLMDEVEVRPGPRGTEVRLAKRPGEERAA
jgi:anti-sigma regulatory factor (Ser/Thr protein kinase)